jgi:CDP-glucose 4,6-dehydratase
LVDGQSSLVGLVSMATICSGFWEGRRVFVTGHTGFKGSWLCHWLASEGACLTGYALPPPDPSHSLFVQLDLQRRMKSIVADVRDPNRLLETMRSAEPEVVFHLAAQPLVRLAYREPRETWETNVLGTVNLLECLRLCEGVRSCVVVTSDKCYESREWVWGYRESDPLGGNDPYSASKGAAEIAVASWRRSFLVGSDTCRLASARAGNVIGGGDWAPDRLASDFVRSVEGGKSVVLRNPEAVRPWQHVLEPLSGYLHLAWRLSGEDGEELSDSWNFGPSDLSVTTVGALAELLVDAYGAGCVEVLREENQATETGALKLDSSKASAILGWRGLWDVRTAARRTAQWYCSQHQGGAPVDLVDDDILQYKATATAAGMPWITSGATA